MIRTVPEMVLGDRRRTRPEYVPSATYRLQLHPGFTLDDARGVVPYLERLGIGACYTSPYFTAAPGSTHGYDVANHNEINPELGGDGAHDAFIVCPRGPRPRSHRRFRAQSHGDRRRRQRVVERRARERPGSPAAAFFDIDWAPVKPELHGETAAADPRRPVRPRARAR